MIGQIFRFRRDVEWKDKLAISRFYFFVLDEGVIFDEVDDEFLVLDEFLGGLLEFEGICVLEDEEEVAQDDFVAFVAVVRVGSEKDLGEGAGKRHQEYLHKLR